MKLSSFFSLSKRPGATFAGVFGVALSSVLLLCGAGLTPTGNEQTADVNANGYNLTNAATVSATNMIVSGSLTVPTSFTLPFSQITSAPSFLTANQTITLSGDGSGSGTTSVPITVTNGTHLASLPSNAALYPTLNQNTTGSAGSAGSVALSGVTGTGTGFSAAAAHTVDGLGGLASCGSSLPFILGPTIHNFLFIGDSLTVGPGGNSLVANQSMAAVVQYLGLGSGGALDYDLGFSEEKTSEIATHWSGGSPVTTTITTTSGSATATVASASGISNGMCIGSANTVPNTTLTISGTTVTLSNKAIASGAVTCSIAIAPIGIYLGGLYPGGAANGWANFNGTAHQLSYAVSGIATDVFLLAGANDYYDNVGAETTLTATTVSGSPNITVTSSSGTYTGLVAGLVLTGTGMPTSPLPPYIVSGQGTASLVLSANATASGSATLTVHYPTTAFATWQTAYNGMVTTAHADGDMVTTSTLPPAGNNTGGVGQGAPVSEVFREAWNAYILANTAGADHVFDLASQLPPYGSIVGSPYYSSADWLHPSFIGDAMLGRYINSQYLFQEFTGGLGWNPFAPGLLPDAWHSLNIPKLNQAATVTGAWQFGSASTGGSLVLPVYSELDIDGGVSGPNATLVLNAYSTNTEIKFQQTGVGCGDILSNSSGFNITGPASSNTFLDLTASGSVATLSAAKVILVDGVGSGTDLVEIQHGSGVKLTMGRIGSGTFNGFWQWEPSESTSGFVVSNNSGVAQVALSTSGNIVSDAVGGGLQVKEGSNAKQGTATLAAGTVTVSDTAVTSNSRIFLTVQSLGTVTAPKAVAVTSRVAATSFTITSADATDTSVVAYEIFEPAP